MSDNDAPEHQSTAEPEGTTAPDDTEQDDGQTYVDRDKIDFDPDDGLLSGTAIDGTSDIPGPHEQDDGQTDDSPTDD